jgi:hypothetical protein
MISNYTPRPIRIDFQIRNPRVIIPDFTRSLRDKYCMYLAKIWWLVSQSNSLPNGISFIGIACTFPAFQAHFPQRPRTLCAVKGLLNEPVSFILQ